MTKVTKQYHNFDQILADENVNDAERISFTRQWLRNNYGIAQYDPEWVDQLTNVHDHDNMPKHFGEISVGSAFTTALLTYLVRLPDGWHLTISQAGNRDGTPIHPKTEASYTNPANQKARLHLAQVLKTGKVSKQPVQGATFNTQPQLTQSDLFAQKDAEAKVEDNSELSNDSVKPDSVIKTTSVGIDLSQYKI